MSDKIRNLLLFVVVTFFAITLFDALFNLKGIIFPGVSLIYNSLGPNIAPNMVTSVVFDWRGYDTLGETLILISAVLIVLLIFGRGKLKGDDE